MPPWAICASRDRSAYTYTPSGRVPAQIASSWLRFARLTAPVVAAYGNSGGVVSGARAHRSAPVDVPDALTLCIANPRHSASSRNSAAVAATLPLLAYRRALPRPKRTAPAVSHFAMLLHSALGLRPRRGALRLLRSSLRSPNLIAFGDRRILPSLRSALTPFGGYARHADLFCASSL